MGRFTKDFRFWASGLFFALCWVVFPSRADDTSTLLSAPKFPPYQWFASTDPKHQNNDYVLLKPGETRRVPLSQGVLLRLWSTAFEPDKIELSLQNGSRVLLLQNNKAMIGNYYQKAFTLYPTQSSPAAARDLKNGAALIVVNKSKTENKWFYQAAVRPQSYKESIKKVSSQFAQPAINIDLKSLISNLQAPAELGLKNFRLPKSPTTPYRLCVGAGSARSKKGQPIPILNVTGEGAFVGLVLDIRPAPDATRRTFAFLEGNETLIADGKKYEGTGAEDFFNSAWYFPDKPFSQKYHGLTQKSTLPPSITAYRWMIPDAVSFKKNFKFKFEHGNGNNSSDLEFRWVAFWYQKPPFKFEVADELNTGQNSPNSLENTPAAEDNSSQGSSNLLPVFAALGGAAAVAGWALARKRR